MMRHIFPILRVPATLLARWLLAAFSLVAGLVPSVRAETMLQYFNTTWPEITAKMPELAEAGYTSLWLPPPTKGSGGLSVGYDLWDPFDLGSKNQRGSMKTRYGTEAELLTLVEYGCEPFDALVINAELTAGSLDLSDFFLNNPHVRHVLIYNEPSAPLQVKSGFAQENVQISHAALPNEQAIRHLMALVDAPQWKQAVVELRRAYA